MKKYIIFIRIVILQIALLSYTCVSAQDQIESDFSSCNANNLLGQNGVLSANAGCVCGVEDLCVSFSGDDFLQYDMINGEDLSTDFTLSFYFWIEETNSNISMEIASIRDTCIRDSSFVISYLPRRKTILVEFANSNLEFLTIEAPINPNFCWHSLNLIRRNDIAILWLDGQIIDEINIRNIRISKKASLNFGKSKCTDIGVNQSFVGKLDELLFYNTAISTADIRSLELHPDRIITKDTTIFEGESIQIETGDICTNNFNWNNTETIDNPMDTDPIVTPVVSTTYKIEIDYNNCQTEDSVRINVVNAEKLGCEDLLLPNAFTPNGDNVNDDFGISNGFLIDSPTISFQIMNKWGAIVFETSDKRIKWDGKFNDKILNTDVFVYKIVYGCQNTEYSKAGNFTLLR